MNMYVHDPSSLHILDPVDHSSVSSHSPPPPHTLTSSSSDPEKSLSHFLTLLSTLDSQTVLQAVSPKLFDHFTLWDLMLAKAKLNEETGSLSVIVNDAALVLCELKILIENCLRPILVGKLAVKKKSDDCIEFDDMMTMAMGLDTNLWLKMNPDEISYSHSMLDVDHLFPSGPGGGGEGISSPGKAVKIKKELDGEEGTNDLIDDDDWPDEDEEDEEEDEEEVHLQKKVAKKKNVVAARKTEDGEDDFPDDGEKVAVKDDPEYKPERRSKRTKVVLRRGKRQSAAAAAVAQRKRRRRTKSEIEEDKKSKGDFTCAKCGKNYLNFTAWYKHMEKTCASRASLRISIRTVGDKFYCAFKDCDEPKRPFDTKDEVHDHWATYHVDEDQKIVPCFLCEMKFATIGAKKVHMTKVHVKENPLLKKKRKVVEVDPDDDEDKGGPKEKHLCLKCGQSMNKESGKKHEEKCNGMYVRRPEYKKVEDEYFCTVNGCNVGYGFNSMYGLRKHFHGKHTREEEKFFHCDYCDEKFSFKTTRNKHITEKHMKNHVCDICGKGFGGRSKLMQHRFLHTGEKPFACSKCDYRAAKRCNVEAHMESKHNIFQQKNFICAICNKQFVTMGRVRRHMAEIHADENNEHPSPGKKKKRQRAAPPPVPDVEMVMEDKDVDVVVKQQEEEEDQEDQDHHHQHLLLQDDVNVQYLQSDMVHPGGETQIITVRPMY